LWETEDLTATGEGKKVKPFAGTTMLTVAKVPWPSESPRTQFMFVTAEYDDLCFKEQRTQRIVFPYKE